MYEYAFGQRIRPEGAYNVLRLGMPYKGSKNAIARDIIDILPAGDVFVDLFAGGVCCDTCSDTFTQIQTDNHE